MQRFERRHLCSVQELLNGTFLLRSLTNEQSAISTEIVNNGISHVSLQIIMNRFRSFKKQMAT